MLIQIVPYLVLVAIVGSAVLLLTSKRMAEKLVTVGILPRAFLGVIPALQSVIRVFGAVLVFAGVLKIAIDSGYIDYQLLQRYAFPVCLILLGAVMLLMSRRDNN